MKYISSRENTVFKRLKALVEDARTRREEQASIIDGDHLLQAALEASWPIQRLILREDVQSHPLALGFLERLGQSPVEVIVLSVGLFNSLSPVVTPTGILAEIPFKGPGDTTSSADDVLVLAGVQDAGNMGSLLRTAVAAGFRQVWLDRQCTQAWSPKALRAGMGAQFCINIREGCDIKALLANNSRQVLATSLGAESVSLYDLDLRGPKVWLFGSEGQGLPPDLLDLAHQRVRIPMPGQIESLNVGAAAAVCFFEQVRQRINSDRLLPGSS